MARIQSRMALRCKSDACQPLVKHSLENKLPSIEDRGQTDLVTVLANPNP